MDEVSFLPAVCLLVPEATTTAKSSSTVTTGTETIKGDINGDGVVGVDDAVILLQYYAKKAAGLNPKWEDLK